MLIAGFWCLYSTSPYWVIHAASVGRVDREVGDRTSKGCHCAQFGGFQCSLAAVDHTVPV